MTKKITRKQEVPALDGKGTSLPSNNNVIQLSQTQEPPASTLIIQKAFRVTPGVLDGFLHLPHTERGNAGRLARLVGKKVRYVRKKNSFIVYDGKSWIEGDESVMKLAIYCMDRLKQAAKENDNGDLRDFASQSQTRAKFKAMVDLLKYEPSIAIDTSELDTDKFLLNVQNGTIDLRTGQLQTHDPDNYMTMISPVSYDINALCPQFLKFLDEITCHDVELQHYIKRLFGYLLTGDISVQALFFLLGSGENGKSVLLRIMKYIMGLYAAKTGSSTLMAGLRGSGAASPDLARLQSVRMVLASELDKGDKFSESLIKEMTGGEAIVARKLYQDYFEFDPEFKIIFGGNHKPKIEGEDDGIWRRFHLIPFNYKVPEGQKDPQLYEKLMSEASGILNWMIEGCLEWQRDGLNPPEIVRSAVAEYRKESSSFEEWLDEKCCVSEEASASAKDLYDSYHTWATLRHEKPQTRKSLGAFLTGRFEKANVRGIVYYGVWLIG